MQLHHVTGCVEAEPMVVADIPSHSLLQEPPPDVRAFLQFFGTVCSVPTVRRFGSLLEGGMIHYWVQLNDDDEDGQNAVYDALRRFQMAEGARLGGSELHII